MKKANKWVILIIAILTLAVFILFIFPNKAASENQAMVSIFEPDEYAVFTVLERMTTPKPDKPSFYQHYFLYDFYHYGFPFFSISSLPVFLTRWMNQYENLPLVMASLRQFVNVLPSLIALLIIVYMQDQFSSYKSVLLFLALLSFPAVVKNSMWWHPDGLTMLFSAIALFFLWKDEQKFSKYFHWAAVFAGILTATKLIGVFFLAVIIPSLLWKLKDKTILFKDAIGHWLTFALIMSVAFFIANPFLFTGVGIRAYIRTLILEFTTISKGYDLVYTKGFAAAWKGMQPFYGSLPFFLATAFSFFLGFKHESKRNLTFLLFWWLLPLTFTVLFTSHFKYQYWMPAAIPAFSMLIMLLPDKKQFSEDKTWIKIAKIACLGIVTVQIIFFNIQNVNAYRYQLTRQETSASIQFYAKAVDVLDPTKDEPMQVYYDYRVYVPYGTHHWQIHTSFDMLDYGFILDNNFDILLLINQRVKDYLNPNAEGINPSKLQTAREFYADVRDNQIKGYTLLYEEEFGKVFIRDDWYEKYYTAP